MAAAQLHDFLSQVLDHCPEDWLKLTTHRLDIYHEERAKVEFLEKFEGLYQSGKASTAALESLPTAYDYIRLGHPLSSVLEWALAQQLDLKAEQIISFASQSMPLLAILRTNLMRGKKTQIFHQGDLPRGFDAETLTQVYAYEFDLARIDTPAEIPSSEASTVLISENQDLSAIDLQDQVDFHLSLQGSRGSLVVVDSQDLEQDIAAIQHVRRRESISMTPADCFRTLQSLVAKEWAAADENPAKLDSLRATIASVTGAPTPALVASSGLSMQYAIMMGLIDEARESHPGKEIKIIVPPNCYGGTNDQARRVAAAAERVEIMDLPVDGDNDMVRSTDQVLARCAELNAVPLIIAEIPTNPRVEVPELEELRRVLSENRSTAQGELAVAPVFILDQTFCPNVQFLKDQGILASVRTISYVSGSKFPSGGKCTAGYCVANQQAATLMTKIEKHLKLCDNQATTLQIAHLDEQMPSMLERISKAYHNTREFVNFIEKVLPTAKINFVSEELAAQEFTPSVFSLDLPTRGDSPEEREAYKRKLNKRLIDMMISEIPAESKYCVSYGQLKGCYWTIPATSTQGTTKEADKDYIARVSVSPDLDLAKHKEVFQAFVDTL